VLGLAGPGGWGRAMGESDGAGLERRSQERAAKAYISNCNLRTGYRRAPTAKCDEREVEHIEKSSDLLAVDSAVGGASMAPRGVRSRAT
jgi:hypothetical protein